jgi:NAD(P)-dependent dehydrogenase (short-subunit alcohol dehydrogenase family)
LQSRAVSRIYDDSLASVEMNVTQLAILRAIGRAGDGGGALSPLATPQSAGSSALQKSWRRMVLDTAYERTSFCPGFVRTPLVDKQIPEQARALGLSEDAVVKEVMLKDTVDGEFTTTQNVAEAAPFFALPLSNRTRGPASQLS